MGVGNRVTPHEFLGGIRKEARDFFLLGVTGHADHKLAEGVMAHAPRQGREGVDRHPRWLELADFGLDDLEVILQSR